MEQLSHNQLQQKCWVHLWNNYPESRFRCWHTSNEEIPVGQESRKQHMIRLSQKKAIGSLKGVWDLVFYRKGVLHIFEFKVGKDHLSDEQIRFRDSILAEGGKAYEIRNFDTFVQITTEIFNGC